MNVFELTEFLAPFLPSLMNAGNKVVDSAIAKVGQKAGEDAWDKAKAVWAKLKPKIETKSAALKAAEDVAKAPNDENLQIELRVQLEKLLEQDQLLAQEIFQIMQENAEPKKGDNIVQNVTGNHNQIIGNVQDSKVVRDVGGNVNM